MRRLVSIIKHSYACGLMFAGIAISVSSHAQTLATPPFVALSGADISYASADFQYVGHHWIADGSAVFAIGEKSSFGMEAGYNVLSFWKQTEEGKSFLPFVRYDAVWGSNRHAEGFNKITFGLNFEWVPNLQLKAEKSARFINGETQWAYNIGVKYTLEF